jgi:hypothetical protein
MSQFLRRTTLLMSLSMSIGLTAGDPGVTSAGAWQGDATARSAAFRVVVVAGEDAVNIVQQKTAVAPVVEVRDQNDQPVGGAVVTFAIRSGRASFNGVRTLTLTTNAAGRAAAAGLTPTGSGTLQITASAAFQGQTAVATIAQTNVMTAAQAAAASAGAGGGGAGGGSAAGAAGGGTGGGLSTTTLAVVGGAAAGGAVAVKGITGGSEFTHEFTHYEGPFAGSSVTIFPSALQGSGCSTTSAHTGTVSMDIKTASDGSVSGTGQVNETRTLSQSSCPAFPVGSAQMDGCCSPPPPVTGTTASMTFIGSHGGGAGTNWTYAFSGALNGTVITGTFTLTVTDPANPTVTAAFPLTLR